MRLSRFAGGVVLPLICGVVFLVGLIVYAPARVLLWVLPGEQVALQGVQGSLWNGRASQCVLRLPQGNFHLGSIAWSLEPSSLLLLAPKLHLNSEWGMQRLSGEVVLRGAQDFDLRDFDLSVAAELLQRFAPVLVEGVLAAQVESLSLRDGLPHEGKGRILWQQGSFRSPKGSVALGSYAVDFHQEAGEPLLGEVVTIEGPLQAAGKVSLNQRQYTVDVFVNSEAQLDPQVKQAFDLMATPVDDGYQVKLADSF